MTGRSMWRVLGTPRWTALSRLGVPATRMHDELFQLTPCLYAMANAGLGGTDDDPGVGALLWARTPAVALHVYDNQRLTDDVAAGHGCAPPPADVIGFTPLTFGAVVAHAKAAGQTVVQTANYRFADSRFVCSSVATPDREYMFAAENPADRDEPIAIRFQLPR